ncbi:L,D-transpeptidase family protein [Xanthomonadaceae bacterium JHOS43]|nr:L,D-transpeptidase family protein [Xanthomonadaceae bacterium JHOS43]MCX7563231.1 L,D-transpeptidase family protein [Xanthomonadaceae bacterium XH05]
MPTRLWLPAALIFLAACSATPPRPVTHETVADTPDESSVESPLLRARQLVVVSTPSWDSPQGELHRYERRGVVWHEVGQAHAVSLGRNGSAWGLGLHPVPQPGPEKHEGDGRSPAGVFALTSAFGYDPQQNTALPYLPMQESHYCIDVPASPLYNRIVDARDVGAAAVAGSTEPMRLDLHNQGDIRYALGIIVDHNPHAVPEKGSCIFVHLRRAPDETTAGCTSMEETDMQALLQWIDPEQHPVLVLLPEAEYARLKSRWGLPEVALLQ